MSKSRSIRTIDFPLHEAAEAKNQRQIRRLLAVGRNIDEINHFGDSPLITAVFHQNAKATETLLIKGANPELTTKLSGSTALHIAVEQNAIDCVKLLLKFQANVNSRDKNKLTPIHLAALLNRSKILELLLKAGGNPNCKDNDQSRTPLHLATTKSNLECITILAEFGCELNATDCWGETALFNAVDNKATRLLLILGSDISITNKLGSTPITRNNNNAFQPGIALAFAEHTQNLLSAGLSVGQDNLNAFYQTTERFEFGIFANTRLIPNDHWSTLAIEFEKELELLCRYRVGERTYKYLLTAHPDKVASATKDEDLVTRYFSRTLSQTFPNYAWLIEFQYRQGVNRKVLTIIAEDKITEIIGASLPTLCIEKIISFLDNPNLRTLRQVSTKKPEQPRPEPHQ